MITICIEAPAQKNDSDLNATQNESQHQQHQQHQRQQQQQQLQQQQQQQKQQKQQRKHGDWGNDITTISNEDVCFVFQNINGLTMFTGVHESLKARMVDLNGTVMALAETNVNWKNFKFHDDWEAILQQSYASLHFSHSSCDEGK